MDKQMQTQLQQYGISSEEDMRTVEKAMAAGVQHGQLIDWLRKWGPSVLEIVRKLLELKVSGGEQLDPTANPQP